ncbi:MAG: glucosidase [Vicinamibacteria bacterium]|nr:glucosidase [Vicinamibacteria bacterium]
MGPSTTAEHERLLREASAGEDWRLFGPYLAERQWGTVREDYSADGACWDYFPHDHARSRAYRWGEDGLLGFCDREARLCFGLALWNGRDPILKERLFGLAAPEGNHGEDVKELYYYLDSTPTYSYFKALYKYPLWAYPYEWLVREGRGRDVLQPEFEIEDTGIFDRDRYVDVTAEYAKASPTDVVMRITLANRSGEDALLHVIPQLWFRNTWSWGREGQPGYGPRPRMRLGARRCVALAHEGLGRYLWEAGIASNGAEPRILFTENETNMRRLFGCANPGPFVKDAFHEHVVAGRADAVNPENEGSKAGAHYRLAMGPRESVTLVLRLASEADVQARLGLRHVDDTLAARATEADLFYSELLPPAVTDDEKNVLRQGYASLLWSRQFYNFNVADWLQGDPAQPAPPGKRLKGRNCDWTHLVNHDLISVPDKWEYPWYAAWDLAFHMIPFARVDPAFAREQLALFLSDRYVHPSGQLPAYEFAFADVNPPVHAWACLRVFEMSGGSAHPDGRAFLEATFDALVRNFRWWRSLEDVAGNRLLKGGFLGLDNISAFERGVTPPLGGYLEQADGTGWMGFFALTMLRMAVELGRDDPAGYDDLAVEFFESFAGTVEAVNRTDGRGLWDEEWGFYFDHINVDGRRTPVRIWSMVGLIPFFAVHVLERRWLEHLPKLQARVDAYLKDRPHIDFPRDRRARDRNDRAILAVPSREQLLRVLTHLLDETSLLGPTGIRSMSRRHHLEPFVLRAPRGEYRAEYAPDDSRTRAFGINSNWRGPVWFPLNYLMVEALYRYHDFYGDTLRVECPTGSGAFMNLREAAIEIERRLASTFLADQSGRRPCHGDSPRYRTDPHFKNLVLFYEYFSGDSGRGFGASHQTGWTTLALRCIEDVAKRRETLP